MWIATAALTFFFLTGRVSSITVSAVLTLHWLWAGVVYHAMFFTPINPAAWLFAVAFVGEAFAFAWFGIVMRRLVFDQGKTARGLLAAIFMVYALAYPAIVVATGHAYPRAPIFAVPCPTALFTTGVLLSLRSGSSRSIFLIPIAWSIIGGSAALLLGMTPDLMLFAAAGFLIEKFSSLAARPS